MHALLLKVLYSVIATVLITVGQHFAAMAV